MHNIEIPARIFQLASECAMELKAAGTNNGEGVLSLSLSRIARLPEYLQQGWSGLGDRVRRRQACSVLSFLSIITMEEDNGLSPFPCIH